MKLKMTYSLLAASLLGMAAGNAATIAWSSTAATTSGSYGQTLNTGLFVTTGTQILAENVGGAAQTFDGISFTAGTITFPGGGSYNGFHEGGWLSQSGAYGDTGPDTVTLNSLTVGATYRVQALVYDGRGDTGIPGRTVSFDGINQGQYANGVYNNTWGPGLLVTGTFTADAATQNFTIEAFSGATSKGGQINALTLYQTAVPEPSAALLGGLGMLALLRRRR